MEKEYQAILGVKNRWHANNKVYASQHGLLLVNVGVSAESYRKLAFSDLCGFSITRSSRYLVLNLVFGLLTLAFGALYYFQNFELPIFAGLAVLFMGGLGVNLVKGKSCLCVVSTKFSHARVRAITRTRSALALAEYIKTMVVGIQGDLSGLQESSQQVDDDVVDTEGEISVV